MQHLTHVPAGRRAARRRLRFLTLLAAAFMVASIPGAAAAAVPVNDTPGQAIAFTSIPQTIDQDTTEATVVGDDVGCGAGGLDQASVWYTLTLPTTTQILIDARATGSAIGINVFAGSATPGALVDCVEDAVVFDATAGTTYYLMFADIDEDGTNGGRLQATIGQAPPPVDVQLTVNGTGKLLSRTGEATVGGTVVCSAPVSAFLDVDISQPNGRFTVRGGTSLVIDCGPVATEWLAVLTGDNGKLANGRAATVTATEFACDLPCDEASASNTVRFGR